MAGTLLARTLSLYGLKEKRGLMEVLYISKNCEGDWYKRVNGYR